jgi:ATP-dependent Zn protease
MSSVGSSFDDVLKRAAQNEELRRSLVSNPKDALYREMGIKFPDNVSLVVHENTASTIHLVIPRAAARSRTEPMRPQ